MTISLHHKRKLNISLFLSKEREEREKKRETERGRGGGMERAKTIFHNAVQITVIPFFGKVAAGLLGHWQFVM